jgi:hypothetical protein
MSSVTSIVKKKNYKGDMDQKWLKDSQVMNRKRYVEHTNIW